MAREKFEDALEKLEQIVRRMEAGEMTLDESLKAFEEGIRLVRLCNARLDDAERRVEVLLREGDQLAVKLFGGEDS
ncbi:MAG TPA: exodeoxyribonuclease VII small subunit [Syntrophales bacterium]|jgi:exodeoxyribonuclease VII small subunit|nr:exodeoxyribonuclease VII small subunit [Syntrophales bacterium]